MRMGKFLFPEHAKLSAEARDFISLLLVPDPTQRLGFNGAIEVQGHPFFKGLNWEELYTKRLEAPMRAKVVSRKRRRVSIIRLIFRRQLMIRCHTLMSRILHMPMTRHLCMN